MRASRQLLSLSFALLFIFSLIEISPAAAQTSAPAQESSAGPAPAVPAAPADALPKEWTDAAGALARKIREAMGGTRTATLEFQNISSLSDANSAAIQSALKDELQRERVEVVGGAGEATAKVRVTFSENALERIWTAEVDRDGAKRVEIVPVSMVLTPISNSSPAPVLQKRALVQQATRILDFDLYLTRQLGVGYDGIELLTPFGASLRMYQGDKLVPVGPDPAEGKPAVYGSRDPRGRIVPTGNEPTQSLSDNSIHMDGDAYRYFYGRIVCETSPALHCAESKGHGWPIGPGGRDWAAAYEAGRNYFRGGTIQSGEVQRNLPDFYSAAFFDSGQKPFLILTGLDRTAHLYSGDAQRDASIAMFQAWGDDIVGLGTGCDGKTQLLATGTGDWTRPDQLQLYEIEGTQAAAEGQPLQFSGPITALWPSDDGKSAHVVSRDLATGMYEASIVTVVCNN